MTNFLYHGDCLAEMYKISDHSIDLILCDLPYGTTVCKWDTVIPFEPLWEHYWRVLKPNGAVVLFGCLSFTGKLITSQLEFYKYSLVWKKSIAGNFAQAPYRFLSEHEDIIVFSKAGCSKNAKVRMTFNPQGLQKCGKEHKGKGHSDLRPSNKTQSAYIQANTNYPRSILSFSSENAKHHPTQKPVALLEYLIKTYTNENETVLDNCMGSGSTGVACSNTGRNFIGIEKDDNYFMLAKKRIHSTSESLINVEDFI